MTPLPADVANIHTTLGIPPEVQPAMLEEALARGVEADIRVFRGASYRVLLRRSDD